MSACRYYPDYPARRSGLTEFPLTDCQVLIEFSLPEATCPSGVEEAFCPCFCCDVYDPWGFQDSGLFRQRRYTRKTNSLAMTVRIHQECNGIWIGREFLVTVGARSHNE